MTDQMTEDQLRGALRSDPDPTLGPIEITAVIRAGRRRRVARRSAFGGVAIVLVAAVGLATTLTRGSGDLTIAPPADSKKSATLDPAARHAALVTWADCLRDADIPGVTVTGPAQGSDDIAYVDAKGKSLPKNFREENGEWGSASEFCAEKVPALFPELEQQWGDLHSWPAREQAQIDNYNQCLTEHGLTPLPGPSTSPSPGLAKRLRDEQPVAEKAGCVWSPLDAEAEKVLECPSGQAQGGMVSPPVRPWVPTPRQAAEDWVADQSQSAQFATISIAPEAAYTTRALLLSKDGRTIGLLYLLEQTKKGWRVQSGNVCQ
jgi:hypothetical protein